MNPTLDWLKGQSLINVEKKDFTWGFSFAQSGSIVTESFWRLVTIERLAVASEDHDQLFGLQEPVDAAKRVMALVGSKKIINYSYSEVCSDLILRFEDKKQLQFLNSSGGYESWRATNNNVQVVCAGGGRLSEFNLVGHEWIRVNL
ncbi:MAG: hypothetical protein HOP33_04510 [Verrucomicrobia bacterium]|nr:hypothetical protein [Verrucomicrobiota bacterium]